MTDISPSRVTIAMSKSENDKIADQQVAHFYSSEEVKELLKSNCTIAECPGLWDVNEELHTNTSTYGGAITCEREAEPNKIDAAATAAEEFNQPSLDFDSNVDLEIVGEEITYVWSVEEQERWTTSSEGDDNTTDIDNSSATEEFTPATDAEERKDSSQVGEVVVEIFDSAERTLIDTHEKLKAFLPTLLKLKASTRTAPELTLDSEGWNLGMYGTLTVLQMRIRNLNHTYIFDVLALEGKKMFEMEGDEGQSLKKTLESKEHIQLWWDIRQDTEALFHHYDILIGSRIDVQLMKLATRHSPQHEWLRGLASAVRDEGSAWMDPYELESWVWKKKQAKYFFRGSDYQCFNERPLSFTALEYAAGDADVIERLYDSYLPRMTEERWELVMVETDNRLLRAMLSNKPRGNARAPTSFALLPNIWCAPAVEEDMYEEYTVAFEEIPELISSFSWDSIEEESLDFEQELPGSDLCDRDASNESESEQASNNGTLGVEQASSDELTSWCVE